MKKSKLFGGMEDQNLMSFTSLSSMDKIRLWKATGKTHQSELKGNAGSDRKLSLMIYFTGIFHFRADF